VKLTSDDPRLAVRAFGLNFPNPVGMAAGFDKHAEVPDALLRLGFGFVEVGTVTPKAQPGNPRPRLFRLPHANALINRLGFNNEGLATCLDNVRRSRSFRARGGVLGLNIGKNASTPIERAADDYVLGLEGVFPHADYVTVNISSPNTKDLRSLQGDAALDALLSALAARREALARAQRRQVPLMLKVAPDLDDAQLRLIAMTVKRHGIDGVIATNTTVARDAVQGSPHADEAGGLSGAPVFEPSNRAIRALRAELGRSVPIIGVGGVLSGADACAKLDAGADLVQIYTGLIYKGPALVNQCARAMRRHRSGG
jgi:dihydroorotate dehydrogenase